MEIHLPLNPRIDETSVSPIREGINQTYLGRDTYYTRQTGRTANQIFEYCYWYLRSKQDGKNFKLTYIDFFYKNAPSFIKNETPIDMGLPKKVKEYPFDSSYYISHRDTLKQVLGYKDLPLKYDCVIHLRLDDILNECPCYTLLPFSEYINLFKRIEAPKNIIIIGRALDTFQVEYTNCLKRSLDAFFNNEIPIEMSLENTIQEDFDIIGSCRTLIASTSVFWFWSAFLSDNIEKIYYPDWGVCKQMNLECITYAVPFAETLYPLKITQENLHRIFL